MTACMIIMMHAMSIIVEFLLITEGKVTVPGQRTAGHRRRTQQSGTAAGGTEPTDSMLAVCRVPTLRLPVSALAE
jgi:hypothetical protein